MKVADVDAALPAEVDTFAALRLGDCKLLLPQREVAVLELISDLQPSVTPGVAGELSFRDEQWPVYSLSDQLQLAPKTARSRRICVLLHDAGGSGYLGLACDEVGYLEREHLQLRAVPVSMRSDSMLVVAIALQPDAGPAWVTTVADLEQWLARQEDSLYAH